MSLFSNILRALNEPFQSGNLCPSSRKFSSNHLLNDFLLSVFSIFFFRNFYYSDVGPLELLLANDFYYYLIPYSPSPFIFVLFRVNFY